MQSDPPLLNRTESGTQSIDVLNEQAAAAFLQGNGEKKGFTGTLDTHMVRYGLSLSCQRSSRKAGYTSKLARPTAIWAHNINCQPKSAVQGTLEEKVEIEKWCFSGGTPVHIKGGICEIEFLEVGTEVLSRCEFNGELAYKKITTVFQHHPADVLWISFSCEAEYESINGKPFSIIATAEHPFWIKKQGMDKCWRPSPWG